MYRPLGYPLASGDVTYHIVATALYGQICAGWWLTRREPVRKWLTRPFAGVATLFGMLGIAAGIMAAGGVLLLFADPASGYRYAVVTLLPTWAVYYAIYLLIRYRREYPTALIWLLLLLAYLPVYNTVTWYYTTIAWLFRGAYWALLAQIAWRHWGLDAILQRWHEGRPPARRPTPATGVVAD